MCIRDRFDSGILHKNIAMSLFIISRQFVKQNQFRAQRFCEQAFTLVIWNDYEASWSWKIIPNSTIWFYQLENRKQGPNWNQLQFFLINQIKSFLNIEVTLKYACEKILKHLPIYFCQYVLRLNGKRHRLNDVWRAGMW